MKDKCANNIFEFWFKNIEKGPEQGHFRYAVE